MATKHEQIWYASPARLSRLFKWRLYDDTGSLAAAPGTLRLQGKAGIVDCSKIIAVSLVRQPIPWLTIAFAAALVIAAPFLGIVPFFTWKDPVNLLVSIGAVAFYAVITGSVQWVEVTYTNEAGSAQRVYFLDGSGAGWARLFGATRRLSRELQAEIRESPP